MKSYAYEEQFVERVEAVLKTLKDKLSTKLILLITFIYSEEREKYFECLRIKEPNEENKQQFNLLLKIKNGIMKNKEGDLPEGLLEEFSQTLLSTEELVYQINKFIMNQFGTNE